MTGTVECPCCGQPYTVYDGYAFDQSACPACRSPRRSLRERVKPG